MKLELLWKGLSSWKLDDSWKADDEGGAWKLEGS